MNSWIAIPLVLSTHTLLFLIPPFTSRLSGQEVMIEVRWIFWYPVTHTQQLSILVLTLNNNTSPVLPYRTPQGKSWGAFDICCAFQISFISYHIQLLSLSCNIHIIGPCRIESVSYIRWSRHSVPGLFWFLPPPLPWRSNIPPNGEGW